MTKKQYVLSKLSLSRLEGVNPDLVKVVRRAIQLTDQDFMVVEGVRSHEQCMINWGKGRTVEQCKLRGIPEKFAQPKVSKVTWLTDPFASKHVKGEAVDLVPYPVDWNDLSKFKTISVAMKAAAVELNVAMAWGGNWVKTKDYPHFELVG